jgi:predicted dehydrogenase
MSLDITILGGGMIVHDQILPTLYHMQRLGKVGEIAVVATSTARLKDLVDDPDIQDGFSGHSFKAHPAMTEPAGKRFDDLYKQVVPKMKPRQLVLVATPDALHYDMVKLALEHDQHVLCVKPLTHSFDQSEELGRIARNRGLLVGIEYHKRFDRRSLEARKGYRAGRFGRFRVGESRMIEPYYYRHSNFQQWFTADQTDPFTYVGCHYVDLLYFITGLKPTEVSVLGVEGTFPNGNKAWMWSCGRVTFDNGGVLCCINGLGYPDTGAGSNDQGMTLYCEGDNAGAIIAHNDQFRGVQHGYVDKFKYVNPDYYRLVPWDGPGLRPVGYGYDSIEAIVSAAVELEQTTQSLGERQEKLAQIDARDIIATPQNSSFNEQVIQAARQSIQNGGKAVKVG